MADNTLSAKITADITDLKAKLTEADKLLNNYENSIERVKRSIRSSTAESREYERKLADLNRAFRDGKIDISNFERESELLSKGLRGSSENTRLFQKELGRLNVESENAKKGIERLNDPTSRYEESAGKAAEATKDLGGSSTSTISAMSSLSRVTVSGSRGLTGMTSSIQGLVSSFGRLEASTGSSKKAMSTLVSSFTSPAGIAFALITVTSLLVKYGDKLFDTRSKIEKFKEEQERLTKSLSDYKDGLNAVNRVELEGEQSAQSRLVTLELLASQLNDTALADEKRIEAFREMQKLYPSEFSNITDLVALNKGLGSSLDDLTKQFKDEATAQQGRSALVKLRQEEIALTAKLRDTEEGLSRTEFVRLGTINAMRQGLEKRIKLEKISVTESDKLRKSLERRIAGMQQMGLSTDLQVKATDEYSKSTSALNSNLANQEKLLKKIGDSGGIVKVDYELPELEEIQREIDINWKNITLPFKAKSLNLQGLFKDPKFVVDIEFKAPKLNELFSKEDKVISDAELERLALFNQRLKELQFYLGEGFEGEGFDLEGLDEFGSKLENTHFQAELFADGIGASLSEVGNHLTGFLETGNSILDAFVSTIIRGLAQAGAAFLKNQLLDSVITSAKISAEKAKSTANAITIATNAAAAMGPFGITAAGGLIAGQVAMVQAAFASIGKFAQGGVVGGGSPQGDRVPILVNSGEMILNNRQQQRLFSLLDGQLGGLQSNAQPVFIDISGVVKGEDIYLSNNRYQHNRERRN